MSNRSSVLIHDEVLAFRSPDVRITGSLDLLPPPGIFPFLLQTKGLHGSTLGRPSRGPWVAQGPPKPNQAEGRNFFMPRLNADY